MILCAFVTNGDKDGSVQHMALFTVDGRPESSSTGNAAKTFEANHQEMWVRTNKVKENSPAHPLSYIFL